MSASPVSRPQQVAGREEPVAPIVHARTVAGLGYLTLADISGGNILTQDLVDQALEQHQALVDAGVRVAVLTCEGPVFCGGADFKARRPPGTPPPGRALLRTFDASPISWVAAVNAPVIGVGLHLVSICLRVLMADSAWMQVNGWSQGRFPAPLSAELATIVGARRALRMATTEEKVDAAECVRLGLADRVVAAGRLAEAAAAEATGLLSAHAASLAAAHDAWLTRLGTRGQG